MCGREFTAVKSASREMFRQRFRPNRPFTENLKLTRILRRAIWDIFVFETNSRCRVDFCSRVIYVARKKHRCQKSRRNLSFTRDDQLTVRKEIFFQEFYYQVNNSAICKIWRERRRIFHPVDTVHTGRFFTSTRGIINDPFRLRQES